MPLDFNAEEMILGEIMKSHKNTIVFTMESNIPGQLLYCSCQIIDDFIEGKPGEVYLVKKAYCIISKFRYYELHLNLLQSILNFKKLETLNIK